MDSFRKINDRRRRSLSPGKHYKRTILFLFCPYVIVFFCLHRRYVNNNNNNPKDHQNDDGLGGIINDKDLPVVADFIDYGALAYYENGRSYTTEQANDAKNASSTEPSFAIDPLCGGCRKIVTKKGALCGGLIYSRARKDNNTTLAVAASIIGKEEEVCKRCLPGSCDDENSKRYWRYDRVAPPVSYARSHYLSSIPSDHRLPRSAFSNLTAYFSHKENVYPAKRYLFEYNPSIVRIPPSEIPNIVPEGEEEEESSLPVYLASYRVDSVSNCFKHDERVAAIGDNWLKAPKRRNYLGLALLRSDLTIVSDTVVNLPSPKDEDFRLHVLRDQIYLSSWCGIAPIWISTIEQLERTVADDSRVLMSHPFESSWNLVVTTRKRGRSMCTQDPRGHNRFKNLNYFLDGKNNNQTMVEFWPLGPHEVGTVDLERPGSPREGRKTKDDHDFASLPPSFFTLEELRYAEQDLFVSPFTRDHGSVCCVSITDPRGGSNNNNTLFLGLSHVKTPVGRPIFKGLVPGAHFLSRVYAFETTAPYRVVATSGLFCFGFPGEDEQREVPTIKQSFHTLLNLGQTYNCPRIHFVSGMAEKAGDDSKIVFAYGVNDCTSRFVEVNKSDVVQLLFSSSPRPVI